MTRWGLTSWALNSQALGATLLDNERCAFRVWAPRAKRVAVRFVDASGAGDRITPLEPAEHGYHVGICDAVRAGQLYLVQLDERFERPDPASRRQPLGVHGPSAVVASDFAWTDLQWKGLPLHEHVFYEVHVGTFTPEGTLAAAAAHLDALLELGITAIQLMPLAPFPGTRNWGYDGVYPFAVHEAYGGPEALKHFVDAAHARGLAVFLDVVYNHFGPEGNYAEDFGPYCTGRYRTPWGRALNFDGAHSNQARAYVVQNALQWVGEFHADGLRLDAIHGIFDFSARHILEEIQDAVQELAAVAERRIHVIAESDLNDARVIRDKAQHGFGLDAQWSDDFHHAVHALLTGERNGYYGDFGALEDVAKALREGFVYTGQYSHYRQRNHGNSARGLAATKFVVFTQNHDQIGNRVLGDRLATHLDPAAQRLAAALLALAPQLPLFFMGQEYGETAPFCYFISHTDEKLVEAVRRGRKRDFASFKWRGAAPDPQAESTYEGSKIDWSLREREPHRALLDFHRELLRLRRQMYFPDSASEAGAIPNDADAPDVAAAQVTETDVRADVHADEDMHTLVLRHRNPAGEWVALFRCSADAGDVAIELPPGSWRVVLDASEPRFGGPAAATGAELDSTGRPNVHLDAWGCKVLRHAPAAEVNRVT